MARTKKTGVPIDLIEFVLPMPPGQNHLYVNRRNGGRFKNTSHPFFKNIQAHYLKNKQWIDSLEFSGLYEIDRLFCFHYKSIYCKDGRPKKMDVSNRIKAFDDELCKMIGLDDHLFWRGTEEKILIDDDTEEECVLVKIKRIEPRTLTEVRSQSNSKPTTY